MKIKKGDTVMIISGSHKGKTGKVSATMPAKNTVVVAGVNVKTRHQKPNQSSNRNNAQGGIFKEEAPIAVSKVALVRPGDSKKTTRVGFKLGEKGKKVRVARQAKNKEIK